LIENPVLFLGIREEKYYIYDKEIKMSKAINPNLKTNIIFEDKDGILNIENIYQSYGNGFFYFLSGPQQMLSNFKEYLQNIGINKDNIIMDEWE